MPRLISDEELLYMYAKPGKGYSDTELAEYFEVGRDAIWKRRKDLREKMGIEFIETERGCYRVDDKTFLSNLRVSRVEALTLYVAARRLSRSTRLSRKLVQSALDKLALALYQPMTEKLVKAAAKSPEHPDARQHEGIVESLLDGWLTGYKVKIRYRGLMGEQSQSHIIDPYLIEPSPWSDSVYVIGYSNVFEKVFPFKLERIEKAFVTGETYQTPADFSEDVLFDYAWGIWHSDKKPQTIRLRFTGPAAVRRVQESTWHPGQKVEIQPDGSLIWQAEIAEWQEMLPWIRGWGADCEVIEPEGLREEVKMHASKLSQLYNLTSINTDSDSRLLRLWGKTTRNPDIFHPVLYHLIDVAHIAQQMLSSRASLRWRQVLANALNAEPATLYEWLPYLVAMHDIGKISVPFQILNNKQRQRLQAEGFSFGKTVPADGEKLHHSIVGRIVLKEFPEFGSWPENLQAAFTEMISGHHGVFQRDERKDQNNFKLIKESDEWSQLRRQTTQILQNYFLLQWPDPLPTPTDQSVAMVALTGFCILCDWLGSDEDYFTPTPFVALSEYISISRQRAYDRVRDAGFFLPATSSAPKHFASLFKISPRPLQAAIDDIPDSLLASPTLTIIEAPTGEGKTEAALALARRIAALRGTDEMYIALPTTATSNAMFKRIEEHLQTRLGLPKELVRLVHGQDFLKEDDLPVNPMQSIEPAGADPLPSLTWFTPKKKALLAPFGVGTVDQAELTTLNVRHNTLRMIGLAGKTIILDEVHAYDTYMTTIIKRMLTWLSALGTSVILLSATLPTTRRRELAQAFAGSATLDDIHFDAYPNILTINRQTHHFATPDPVQPGRIITLHTVQFTGDDAAAKAQWLIDQVQSGGCACWITNTVKRAQQIFDQLLKKCPADVDLQLLHARLPLLTREAREKAIFNNYGPIGNRPAKGIVVGTQVLEQSLDLDFDVMTTDLAPVDLILQRAGRLHRHNRDLAVRGTHSTPHLHINTTIENADTGIYAEYILKKTLQAIESQPGTFSLPHDYRPLIETVYHEPDKAPAPAEPLYGAWKKLEGEQNTLEGEAELRLINDPNPEYPFYRGADPQGFKEDEDSNGWLVAKTRWAEQESITIIPLLKNGDSAVTADDEVSAPLNFAASREEQLKLLRHSMRISDRALVPHLKYKSERGKLFTDSTLLENVYPLWLEPDAEPGTFVGVALPVAVKLHPQLGLVIGEL